MSLKQAIERMKREKQIVAGATETKTPQPVATTPSAESQAASAQEKPACLSIERLSGKDCCELPWMCFQGMTCGKNAVAGNNADCAEEMRLLFVSHEIVVCGRNFSALRKQINTLSLPELREMPEQYAKAALASGKPVVTSITVEYRE